jgi:hypothetical protein
MTEPSIPFLLTIPGILLLLSSSVVLLIRQRWREGSAEMTAGAAFMAIAIIGSFFTSLYFSNSQYSFEQNQELINNVYGFTINLLPIGLVLFSIGMARHAKLFSIIKGVDGV